MNYTNNYNFDPVIASWLQGERYEENPDTRRISVTKLYEPIKQMILKQRHKDAVTEDLRDLYSRRLGTAVHESFEKVNLDGAEKEVKIELPVDHGYTIVGKFDLVYENIIRDYKTTLSKNLKYDKDKEWIEQLSYYRYLYFKQFGKILAPHGIIYAIILDWNRRIELYKTPIVRIELKLWDLKKCEKKITEKITQLSQLEGVKDEDLMYCTDKEMWSGRRCNDTCCKVKRWCNQWVRSK